MSEIVKNTKVETHIDQRETFVSLRKSFTESGDVAEKLRVLYALQETDNEIEKIVSLRGALPEEVAQIEDEINALVAKSARLEEMISGYEKSIEENKNQMVEIDADTAKYQQQLRLTEGARLLSDTDWSVRRIAEQVGYTDPLYFSRLFRRKYGKSPVHYRLND